MNPINLLPFADHSQKLPAKFLTPIGPDRSSTTRKILTSHFLDFVTAFFASTLMSVIFGLSINSLLLTHNLRTAFAKQTHMPLESTILPVVLLSYFFISYFLNHGQTFGMLHLKSRISMKPQSFRDAFHWSIHSTLLCFSFGISYLIFKKQWESFKSHDYLYEQLMTEKEVSPMNLMTKIEEFEMICEVESQEEWLEAA